MALNRRWLKDALERRGISIWALKTKHHFSPDTLKGWENGTPARPASVRKLALILDLPFEEVVKRLGVEVMGLYERRERVNPTN